MSPATLDTRKNISGFIISIDNSTEEIWCISSWWHLLLIESCAQHNHVGDCSRYFPFLVKQTPSSLSFNLLLGGAAAVSPALLEQKLFDLRQAAKAGFLVLLQERGKDDSSQALDAVQASVQLMEDSPYFNAGFGSSLTSLGEVEMDAIIADGKRLDFGAISSVTSFKNPVQVARSVLDCSEHCLFTAEGAQQFGQQQGIPLIERSQLVHKYAKVKKEKIHLIDLQSLHLISQDRLEEFKTFNNAILCDHDEEKSSGDHDTVGAVAIDQFGNLAAGTSTGGITGKQPGRVGDTPVIGSGAYADNLVGAVSTTGNLKGRPLLGATEYTTISNH